MNPACGSSSAFLAIHVSAVALHALAGQDLWRRMFFLK